MLHFPSRIPGPWIPLLALATGLSARAAQDDAPPLSPQDLVGEWVFFKDQSPPRAGGPLRPNQGTRFVARLEEQVLELEQERPGGVIERVLIALDGSASVQELGGKTWTSSGRFEDGVLHSEVCIESSDPGQKWAPIVSQYTYTRTADGLSVRMQMVEPSQVENLSLYRRPQDVPRVAQAGAKLEQLAWLSGAWTGTMGSASIEERWSPIAGGAMLAISRTVSGQRMVAFEYLRIVERGGGLVYVAQPNGLPPTEFVLTQIEEGRARFENPLHDFPQRIEYARHGEAGLRATISDLSGQQTQTFEFERETR